jgi:hypothetical protein
MTDPAARVWRDQLNRQLHRMWHDGATIREARAEVVRRAVLANGDGPVMRAAYRLLATWTVPPAWNQPDYPCEQGCPMGDRRAPAE